MEGSCHTGCCSGLCSCYCISPCIKTCGCDNPKVFYNFDGSERVEPLVGYFKPTNARVNHNLVRGMSIDNEVFKNGLNAVQQIAAVIRFAHENQLKVKAVGTGCSWSKLTSTQDILMDMKNLNKILKAKPQNEDGSLYHIKVQAGMILHDFVREIDTKYGMSLPVMSNYAKQTVAGLISTSTHGTGKDYPTLSNSVVKLHLIIAKGIQLKVRAAKCGETDDDFESVKRRIQAAKCGDRPIRIHSTDIFRAVAVGLGSLGTIYSVTFECVPVFNLKETTRIVEMNWPSAKQPAGFEIPSMLKKLDAVPERYDSLLVNPFLRNSSQDNFKKTVLRSVFFSSERTTEKPSLGCCGDREATRREICQTDCAASCLQIMASCFPSCIPSLSDSALRRFFHDEPYIHKWYNVLEYFSGNLHFKTAEYFIPIADMDKALVDIVQILQEATLYSAYTLFPMDVRFVKADDLYLSPANKRGPDGKESEYFCCIEVSFRTEAYGIDAFHKTLEDHLFTHYQARPHWGKNNFLNANRVSKLYPDLHKWKRVYLLFNSDGTFDNEFTRNVGFEDMRNTDCSSEDPQNDLSFVAQQPLRGIDSELHHNRQPDVPDNFQREYNHSEVVSSQPKSAAVSPSVIYGRNHFIPIPIFRR